MLHWLRFIILSFAVLYAGPSNASRSDFIVITHASTKQSQLTVTELRRIFAARQQVWSAGGKITVVIQGHNSDAHNAFCRQFLNVFPYQIERIWNQLVFSGQADAPISIDSDRATIEYVAKTPGAIAYISSTDALPDDVRSITINTGERAE